MSHCYYFLSYHQFWCSIFHMYIDDCIKILYFFIICFLICLLLQILYTTYPPPGKKINFPCKLLVMMSILFIHTVIIKCSNIIRFGAIESQNVYVYSPKSLYSLGGFLEFCLFIYLILSILLKLYIQYSCMNTQA